ncbi:YciI family protein [Massilia genomosp. 1]|nr:YciI family protein [Massilia genomosp. 1]
MRFMLLRRSDPAHEAGQPWSAGERAALAAYTGQMAEAGILRDCQHFLPSAGGVRLAIADGRATQAAGPFPDSQELIAGFAVIDVASRDEALAWAARWPAGAAGAAEVEVRLSGCPGGCANVHADSEPDVPGHAVPGQRFAILLRSSKELENETPVARARLDALDQHNAAEARAGVLLGADGLRSSAFGARVRLASGKLTVVDGPFTEIKEMIAGYWLIRAPTLQDAIAWATRNPYPVGPPVEVEIRQLAEIGAADAVTPAGQRLSAHQSDAGVGAPPPR